MYPGIVGDYTLVLWGYCYDLFTLVYRLGQCYVLRCVRLQSGREVPDTIGETRSSPEHVGRGVHGMATGRLGALHWLHV